MNAHVQIAAPETQRPVHVLYLIDEFCKLGGAERMLLNTIRQFPTDRFRCSLATFKLDPSLHTVFESLPCPHVVFPLRKTYDWNALQMARRLRSYIQSQDVTIVHTLFETADLWGGLVAKLSGCRILVSGRRDMGIFRTPKHQIAYRLLRRQFDLVLTVSEAVRTFTIQRDHMHPSRVRTIYNSLESGKVTALDGTHGLRAKLGVSAAAPVIATVAHVRRLKGMDVLLHAAATVVREFPEAMFLVAGGVLEQEYFLELRALIQTLGLEGNVRFLGEMDDVHALLRVSDLFCLPSRTEGFSNALIEAMQSGLPSVATRVGGNAEAVADGTSGYVVDSEDADAMADRILRLLRDPESRLRMGREARRIAETRFSMAAMMRQLTDSYEELLVAKNV